MTPGGTVERAPEFVKLGMCGILNESGQACSKDREHYRPHDFVDRPQSGRVDPKEAIEQYTADRPPPWINRARPDGTQLGRGVS